jgi:hypothetical protein
MRILTTIGILTILLLACNPVKRVLNDPKKFEQIKDAVIRGGFCINDTIKIETIKDSISYRDSIIEREVKAPCADFDTTLADGTHIAVSSGVLTFKAGVKAKHETKVIRITNTVRDRAYENILKSDITKRDSVINVYKNLYVETKAERNELRWKLVWLIIIAVVIIFRKQIIKLVI